MTLIIPIKIFIKTNNFFGEILTIYIFLSKKHGKHLKKPTATTKKNKNRFFVSKHPTRKPTKNKKRETISQK